MEKKPGGALIAFLENRSGPKKKDSVSEEESEYKPSAGELTAAKDILAAIKADDADALCRALYAHSEVQSMGPDSEEEEESEI